MKKPLLFAAALVMVVAALIWMFIGGVEHVEDTNGPDNYNLQTIRDHEIVEMSTGALGGPKRSQNVLTGDSIHFSAEKFTGVYEILYDNLLGKSDFWISLTNYEITGGNFKMVVVHDDRIVATLEPGLMVDYRLEDVSGRVSLRIAGESAAFSFYMSTTEYDLHSHVD